MNEVATPSGSLSLWERVRVRALASMMIAAALHSAVSGQVERPSTQPTTQDTRERDRDRLYTLEECFARFELDPRLSLCHVWPVGENAIGGFVEQPQYKAVLARATRRDVSKIKLLPEESKTQDRFGIVTVQSAILRQDPVDRPGDRDNASDLTLGEPVWILDAASSGALLVHSSDGYLGWVDAAAIWAVDSSLYAGWIKAYGSSGKWIAHEANQYRDAIQPFLAQRNEKVARERVDAELNRTKTQIGPSQTELILRNARGYTGTPYLWGGKTKAGIDCSGLVQVSFADRGILLPRDADQQAGVGKLVATRWFKDALLPGDLLFFVSPHRGNVHHVAIYLGDGKFIHASGKNVHIGSMKPGDPEYDEERANTFAWARRVIQ